MVFFTTDIIFLIAIISILFLTIISAHFLQFMSQKQIYQFMSSSITLPLAISLINQFSTSIIPPFMTTLAFQILYLATTFTLNSIYRFETEPPTTATFQSNATQWIITASVFFLLFGILHPILATQSFQMGNAIVKTIIFTIWYEFNF